MPQALRNRAYDPESRILSFFTLMPGGNTTLCAGVRNGVSSAGVKAGEYRQRPPQRLFEGKITAQEVSGELSFWSTKRTAAQCGAVDTRQGSKLDHGCDAYARARIRVRVHVRVLSGRETGLPCALRENSDPIRGGHKRKATSPHGQEASEAASRRGGPVRR